MTGYKKFSCLKEQQTKMSSVMPFSFNAVELCVVIINEKPRTRAREVCKTLEYNKKTANVVKAFCSRENYAQKYQMSSVHAACTPINWPKYSQKYDYCINEEGMIELLVGIQQPLAKELAENMGINMFVRKQAQFIPYRKVLREYQ